MKIRQLLINLVVAMALGLVFYVSTLLIGNFTTGEQNTFSEDRRLADQYLDQQNWQDASRHLLRLSEADPYNGYAFYNLAVCYYSLRQKAKRDINQLKEEQAADVDLDLIESLEENFRNFDQLCRISFRRATEFLRYRRLALLNLALISVDREEWEEAIDNLEQFVDEGYFTSRGLDAFQSLGQGGRRMIDDQTGPISESRLHRFPRFWEVVEKEVELRGFNLSPLEVFPRGRN